MTDELKTEPRKKYLIYVPVSLSGSTCGPATEAQYRHR